MKAAGFRGFPFPMASGRAVYISFRIVWPIRGSAVLSSAATASTVTLSVVVPTSNFKISSTVVSASTTTWSCTNERNPDALTVTLYVPAASGAIAKIPDDVVWRRSSTPVAVFVAVTAALGITAPLGSVTVPLMVPPPPICAAAGNVNRQQTTPANEAFALPVFMDPSLSPNLALSRSDPDHWTFYSILSCDANVAGVL